MVKVIINRGLDGKFQKITEDLEEYGQIYARMMAQDLIEASPVDTGAFMESFYVGSSYGGFGSDSHGRPRKQPRGPYESTAFSRMDSGISALKGSTTMIFGNGAPHATQVEFDHGYGPFGKAANKHQDRMRRAWAEAGL
jgi:hypothetical protein